MVSDKFADSNKLNAPSHSKYIRELMVTMTLVKKMQTSPLELVFGFSILYRNMMYNMEGLMEGDLLYL